MFWISVLVGVFVCAQGIEVPRGSKIRFPYEGPPPPFSSDKSSNLNRFGELGPKEYPVGSLNKPYINQHRSPPTSLREGQLHETRPPPFGSPLISQATKVKGILAPPPPSLSSLMEAESQRHRFTLHRDPGYGERHPSSPRHPQHGNDGHPPLPMHYEKHPINDRHPHPGSVRDDKHNEGGERHRPIYDRPPKGGERYHNQERYPPHLEKPHSYKEKTKIPVNNIKKPLFSPTDEKLPPKVPSRFPSTPQLLAEYAQPTPEQDDKYFQTKLNEEYYAGIQNAQFAEMPTQTRSPGLPNLQLSSGQFPLQDINNPFEQDAFNIQNYGKMKEFGSVPGNKSPFPASTFPQSEEYGSYFDTNLPEWMNEFKGQPAEASQGLAVNSPARPLHKIKPQEIKRQPNKQSQHQKYSGSDSPVFDQRPTKFVNKRNPVQSQKNGGYYESEESGDNQYYQQPSYSSHRPQTDSSYDFQDSSEYDFGSSSDFKTKDFNAGPHNYGNGPKSAGTEWIPINAPNGAVPAKSYEISAPDLSRDSFQNANPYGNGGFQNIDTSRRTSARVEKSRGSTNSEVVYGAREKRRQNEGVVSASVMVDPY